MRQEICDLMSMEEVNKPALRIVIPSGNDNFSFRSASHATTANIIKNICKKNWKPVDNALFVQEELKDKLLHCLSKSVVLCGRLDWQEQLTFICLGRNLMTLLIHWH